LADAQESLEWQACYVQSNFEKTVDVNLNMIRSIASNPTIVQFVIGEAGIPLDAVQATLYQYDQVMGDDQNTAITNDQGMQIARGTGECIDVSDREYFKEAMAGNVFISNVTVSKTTGKRMILYPSESPMSARMARASEELRMDTLFLRKIRCPEIWQRSGLSRHRRPTDSEG
jgi:methyl-accepting chemotaxis protein